MISHQEEELESAIWGAIQRFKCTCPDANLFVDAVIVAARHYAAGDSEELTAMRRRILAREAAEEQTSPSSAEEPAERTGARPLGGSDPLGKPVAGGGATRSTGPSIPRRSNGGR